MVSKNISIFSCRVCLTTDSYSIIMNENNGWLQLFDYCFGLQISPNDIGRNLCRECGENMKRFAKFKRKCLKSFDVWKSKNFMKPDFKMKLRSIIKNTVKMVTENQNDSIYDEEAEEKCDIDELTEFCPDNTIIVDKPENFEYSLEQEVTEHDSVNDAASDDYKLKEEIIDTNENNESEELLLLPQQSLDHSQDDTEYLEDSLTDSNTTAVLIDDVKEKGLCKCGKQFNYSTRSYKLHTRKCHIFRFYVYKKQNENVLKHCGLCEFSTQDIDILCQHLDEHLKKNNLECQLCDYTGQDFAEMAYHRYTHTSDKKFYCLKCHKRFRGPLQFQFHFRSVHLNIKGGLCSFCGLQLASVKSWKEHVKRKHTDIGDAEFFICDCCGLRFVYRNEIVSHLQKRAGLKRTTCNECGATFARRSYMKSHIRNVHTKAVRVKCHICEKTFKSTSIDKHIKTRHGDKLICEVCSGRFNTKDDLLYHMLSHSKERPYKCGECTADYKTKSMLHGHYITKHTNIRPYKCNLCQKRFAFLTMLRRHNSVHTNDRPFKCEDCNRSFHLRKRLVDHTSKMHSNAPEMYDCRKSTATGDA